MEKRERKKELERGYKILSSITPKVNGWREKARAQLGEECSQVFDVHTLTAWTRLCVK
jgi:hypothetical protein